MRLLKKLFCSHKWKTFSKKEYNWEEKIDGTWDKLQSFSETIEVITCEHCGKIKKIKY